MAHLWMPGADGQLVEHVIDAAGWDGHGLSVRCARLDADETWVVLAGCDGIALVNGAPVALGLRSLDSRDEIRAHDGTRVIFADEHVAQVVAFPGAGPGVRCARCTGDLESGTPAVQCPTCGAWFHEQADFPCWTSAASCTLCGHHAGPADAHTWRPEEF